MPQTCFGKFHPMREELGRHMMPGRNLTEMSEWIKRERLGEKAGSGNGISTPWCGWTPPAQRTERVHSPLLPSFSSLPTFSVCSDNRGHGETMQKGKAGGLCGSNMGVVWGAERGRRVRGPWSFMGGGGGGEWLRLYFPGRESFDEGNV